MPRPTPVSIPTREVSFVVPPLLPSIDMSITRIPADQLLDAAVAFVRSALPAFSNTFFVLGGKFANSVSLAEESDEVLRLVQTQTLLLVHLTSEWQRYVFDLNAPSDVDAISQTIDGVFEAAIQFGPGAIDLRGIDPARVHGEQLAAVLRATFSFRDRTPGWRDAIEAARVALERAGLDPKDALYGLL